MRDIIGKLPALPAGKSWEHLAAKAGHYATYGAMIYMPVRTITPQLSPRSIANMLLKSLSEHFTIKIVVVGDHHS